MKAITTQRCSTVGQRPPPARNNGRKTLSFKDQSRGSALLEPMEQPRLPRRLGDKTTEEPHAYSPLLVAAAVKHSSTDIYSSGHDQIDRL